jgi:hypothetical protein
MAISGSPPKNDHSRSRRSPYAYHVDASKEANMAVLLIFVYIFPDLFYAADDTFARATQLYPNKVS